MRLSPDQRKSIADTVEAFTFPDRPHGASVLRSKAATVISIASADVGGDERLRHELCWEARDLTTEVEYKIIETYCNELIERKYCLVWNHKGEVDLARSRFSYGVAGEEEMTQYFQPTTPYEELLGRAVADFDAMTPDRVNEVTGHLTTLKVMAGLAIN